jgi:protein-L-isoaspartate(D-aspartate) O-methyltransferase
MQFLVTVRRRASLLLLLACGTAAHAAGGKQALIDARNRMVDQDVVAAGIKNSRVIQSLRTTPRHEFVPAAQRQFAYLDMAVPIGEGQTISPPFIVAYMTEQLDPQPGDTVLEIGTGSGYQAAILSPLVKDVYTIEIVRPLGLRAARTLARLGYKNVHTKIGDGYLGWAEAAPFDKIIVTCSPENIPRPLVEQLREGGRLIVPLGERYQQRLYLYRKQDGKLVPEALLPVLFVPMTGAAEDQRKVQPDPAKPAIVNGGFEELSGDPPQAVGWHYQRQNQDVEADDAPQGRHYMVFSNRQAGQGSSALQGLAIDGRQVREIELSAWVRLRAAQPGPTPQQSADVAILFYDQKRNPIGEKSLGPWTGDCTWQQVASRVPVPGQAREAIVRIGLFGGTGELALDDLRLTVSQPSER